MIKGRLICGNSIEALREIPDNSIGAVVSDPPYGLGDTSPRVVAECLRAWAAGEVWSPKGGGFLDLAWDAWVPGPELWREVFRVLKPGGHALIFAGSRTVDLMGIALRLSGFELRDTCQWLYGSGFPKSHSVDMAIDRELGRSGDREVIARVKATGSARKAKGISGHSASASSTGDREYIETEIEYTRPASEEARRAEGWGSALKPGHEPIILARKPLEGTLARNVLKYGVGGLNINGCRLPVEEQAPKISSGSLFGEEPSEKDLPGQELGRWPANVIFDERAAELLNEQEPQASRFFYCAKPSVQEKEAGLEGHVNLAPPVGDDKAKDYSRYNRTKPARRNTHPTVKPIDLMRYLVRLITPEDQVVLDPFAGSGTTLIAAGLEGREYLGIELDPDHVRIAQARLDHWLRTPEKSPEDGQMELF